MIISSSATAAATIRAAVASDWCVHIWELCSVLIEDSRRSIKANSPSSARLRLEKDIKTRAHLDNDDGIYPVQNLAISHTDELVARLLVSWPWLKCLKFCVLDLSNGIFPLLSFSVKSATFAVKLELEKLNNFEHTQRTAIMWCCMTKLIWREIDHASNNSE